MRATSKRMSKGIRPVSAESMLAECRLYFYNGRPLNYFKLLEIDDRTTNRRIGPKPQRGDRDGQ